MNIEKIADLFLNMCILKERFSKDTLSEEEKMFLDWLSQAINVVNDNILGHFVNLCQNYNDICKEQGITPKINSNGSLPKPSVSEENVGLAAGIGMAEAGIFDNLTSNNERSIVEEHDTEVCLSEDELMDLAAEMDF